ncbi:flavin reductase [Sulfurovum lithotrophicum]|uniref:Flavin reductase n=1 Tax=Sulfurovum lithotrophicum TaxID=206403 RepID=A0A7U4RQF8_9BACT|nr:flavin reductase family protein [Sulfurovum lithotrophicum]AKF24701.1 flavin reductase [Sulfurovum lithotrophicum]
MIIDFENRVLTEKYALMSQLIIPRPIAWIVTKGEVLNLAPFSYFTGLSSNPPTMIVSIGHRPDGTPKDTLRNLRETKKCVVCMIEEEQLEAMHFSSKGVDADVSESELFDIPMEEVVEGFPPMVKGVKAAFFCEYLQEVDLKGSKTIPVIIEIKHLYINESIITDSEKMTLELDAIARIGKSYAKLGKKITPPDIP